MKLFKLTEDIIDNWVNGIFNRIYKKQEDDALRQIRKADIDKGLKARLAQYAEDAKKLRQDIESGKY